jgi:hypothetical protein
VNEKAARENSVRCPGLLTSIVRVESGRGVVRVRW